MSIISNMASFPDGEEPKFFEKIIDSIEYESRVLDISKMSNSELFERGLLKEGRYGFYLDI